MGKDMVVYTIRLPRSLREDMERVDIEWSKEIRRFIEERVKAELYRRALKRVEELNSRFVSRGSVKPSWILIREDRER